MSEEVKDQEAGPKKKKKVNKLAKDELTKKIEALESLNQKDSKYYKHLIERKAELESIAS